MPDLYTALFHAESARLAGRVQTMKLVLRFLVVVCVAVLVFGLAGVIATWAPDRSVAALSARWAAPPSQFLNVLGMQVHVRDEGPRDDPHPIVLLHGTSSSLHTWDGWAEALRAKRRVIRMDLPGYGLTGPHPQNNYAISAYVQLVQGVVDTLGVRSFVLVGNSLGGHIAWAAAVAMPQRVSQLVLVDSAGYPIHSESVPLGFMAARTPVLRDLMLHILPRGLIQSSLRNVYGDPAKVSPELVDRYYELTLRAGNRAALAKRFEQPLSGDTERLKTLKIPTLVLWGSKDRLIPPDNGKRFAADIAGARLVEFPELGHVPQEEDPVQTVAALRDFLKID
jgi:pimeloyl-ACP methyl ester carboxylesterase